MQSRILSVIPNNKISYNDLVEVFNKRRFGYSFYFVPLRNFDALLYNNSLSENDRRNDKSYKKNNNGYEYINISERKLLKLVDIRNDGTLVFSVSRSDYIKKNEDGVLESNLYQCKENELDKKSWLYIKSLMKYENYYYAEILLSKEEYFKNLIMCDDYLVMFLTKEEKYFNIFKKVKEETIRFDFTKIGKKDLKNKFKNLKYEGLYTYQVIVPIVKLYMDYDCEVIKHYYYSIIDTLNDLLNIDEDISEVRYLNLLNEISKYLRGLLSSADKIDGAKLKYIIYDSAEKILEDVKKKDSDIGNEHKLNSDGSWSEDSVDKLNKKLKCRNELLEIYDNF